MIPDRSPQNDPISAHRPPQRFRIALSFSGEIREYVEALATDLSALFSRDHILYDKYHEAAFARPDLAFHLPPLYSENSDLVVVAFDSTYSTREWCGLEWSAIYSLIKQQKAEQIMLLSFGHERPPGLFGLEGTVDLQKRSPRQTAALVLERLAIVEDLPRNYYISALSQLPPANSDLPAPSKVDTIDAQATALEEEYYVVRRDRAGKSRRRALRDIARRAGLLSLRTMRVFRVRLMTWHSLLIEAKYYRDYAEAVAGLDAIFRDFEATSFGTSAHIDLHTASADIAVDIAQSAPASIDLNPLVGRLNGVISQLGHDIGVGTTRIEAGAHLASLLVARSKCRRALAKLFRRRMPGDKSGNNKGKDLQNKALADAREAQLCAPSSATQFELALALFANASTFSSEVAIEGLGLLSVLHSQHTNVLPTYELVRQLRSRHQFDEAIDAFLTLPEREDDQRRFHLGITEFAACVLGKYHETPNDQSVMSYAIQATAWLQECIAFEHHRAKEIVDLCYMKAICGTTLNEFTQPLQEFKADSPTAWNALAQMARAAASGEAILGEGLLLGLEDPIVWSRIGTLYADFASDFPKALEFYDRALLIQPHSPLLHFNKARILAYRLRDFHNADNALRKCHATKRYLWSWYKVNEDQIHQLDAHIREQLAPSGSET